MPDLFGHLLLCDLDTLFNFTHYVSPTGSAFTVKVTGEGRMKESITRRRRAASVANVGSQCDLSLKIPGMTCGKNCINIIIIKNPLL